MRLPTSSSLPGCLALAGLGLCALLGAGCRSAPPRAPAAAVVAPLPAAEPADSGAQDVRLLASEDFLVRSRAAQRLVRGGEASLAALGAAGAQPVAQPGSPAESSTAPVIAVIVEALPTPEVSARLADPHALVREAAAHEVGRRHAWDAVPRLIEALGDPSEDVRLASRQALKRISGEVSDPWFASAPRADVQQRWRVWWNQVGRARATEASPRG